MAATYGVGRAEISFPYIGAALGYILACLLGSWLVNRLGRKSFLWVGSGCFCLGTLAMSAQLPLAALGVAPLAIGFGAGASELGWNERIASSRPEPGAALNALHASFGIGALAGPLVTGLLLSGGWAWPGIYRLLAALGAAVAVASWWGLPRVASGEGRSGRWPAAAIARPAVTVALAIFFFMGSEFALGDWNFSFLVAERGLGATVASSMGSGYWLGITSGRLILAVVGVPYGERRVLFGCLGCVVAGVSLFGWFPQPVAGAAGLFVAGLGLGPVLPLSLALLAKSTTEGALLSGMSLAACLGSLGKGLLPWVGGLASDAVGLSVLPGYVLALVACLGICLQRITPQLRGSER